MRPHYHYRNSLPRIVTSLRIVFLPVYGVRNSEKRQQLDDSHRDNQDQSTITYDNYNLRAVSTAHHYLPADLLASSYRQPADPFQSTHRACHDSRETDHNSQTVHRLFKSLLGYVIHPPPLPTPPVAQPIAYLLQ